MSVVLTTEWFRVVKNSLKQFDKPYYILEMADGVTVLALTKNKEIILVKQYRPAAKASMLELPSGNIDNSESDAEAAMRELYEETGYKSSRLIPLGSFPPMASRIAAKNSLFLALETEKDNNHSAEENIETVLMKQSEFESLIKNGRFNHLAGIATFTLARLRNLL